MILAFLFAIAGFIFFEFAGTHGWMGIPVGGAIGAIIALMRRVGALEERLESLGAPWTPGREPDWRGN